MIGLLPGTDALGDVGGGRLSRVKSNHVSTLREAPPNDRASWATWGIGGVALIIGVTAAALFLDEPVTDNHPPSVDASNDEASSLSTPPSDQAEAPAHPLSLSKRRVIAEEHAQLWNTSAILAGIELIVAAGEPVGPVSFVFGTTIGQPVPGGLLSSDRLLVSFSGDVVTTEKRKSESVSVALADPNCPLDVAFGKLARTTDLEGKKIGILYAMSERHGRPIWLVTDSEGQVYNLNGESCALLRN